MPERVVGVVDHGSGNLHSVRRALELAGARPVVSGDPRALWRCDGLVLPGVGALASCVASLRAMGGEDLVARWRESGKPLLGICVGHQMLFTSGSERGQQVDCLGLWPGHVTELPARRLPHMGWDTLTVPEGSALLAGLEDERFYFVHSCGVDLADPATASLPRLTTTCHHEGVGFVAAVEDGPVCSVQFHPEKSGRAGARLVRNWLEGPSW